MAVRAPRPFRRILVPVSNRRSCDEAMAIACRLAADHGAAVTILAALEVPAELPLGAQLPAEEDEARGVVTEARALAELHGVAANVRVVRARAAAESIVAAALENDVELIVLGAPRRRRSRHVPVFGQTVAYVLAHAPCRVLVAAR